MSTHTPGPWWVTRGREVRAHKPAGSPVVLDTVSICEVYSGGAGIDGADANARLIAAAPDLLEALSRIESCVAEWRKGCSNTMLDDASRPTACQECTAALIDSIASIASAAISKASGGQP